MVELRELAEALMRSRRLVLSGHVMPDGDSVGSTLALARLLELSGKEVTAVCPDPVPAIYRFLPGVELMVEGKFFSDEDFDTIVLVDCSDPERVGPHVGPYLNKGDRMVINIDHHVSTPPYGDLNYIDPKAAAVGEIIYDLSFVLETPISADIATCLYTAIVTDTGSFRYENTTSGTLRRAAHLVEIGVSPADINTLIYEERPLSSIKLLHAALGSLKLSASGRVAWMSLTSAVERDLCASGDDAEGIINYARMIQGVEIAVLFRQVEPEVFKVGFRSKRFADVSALAQLFGGGGHPRASGCMMSGDLAEIERVVIEAAEKFTSETP